MSFAPAGFLASSPLTRALKAFQGYFFSHCLHRACHIVSYLGRLLFVRLSCSLLASDHTCQVPIQSDHKAICTAWRVLQAALSPAGMLSGLKNILGQVSRHTSPSSPGIMEHSRHCASEPLH